jgi:nicotinamidase-related amidase
MRTVNGVPIFSELREIVAPEHTALVVVDMQNDLVLADGWFARNGKDVSRILQIISRVAELVELARQAGVQPVFVEQTTLPGNASDPPSWLHFKTRDGRARTDYALRGTWGQRTIDQLEVTEDDIRIEKFRPSSFHETALDTVLRARGIKSVLVCGTITQGCVQATTMDASFHDYYAVLVEDCVQSYSQPLHENALTFMRSRYETTTVSELAGIWGASPAPGKAAEHA